MTRQKKVLLVVSSVRGYFLRVGAGEGRGVGVSSLVSYEAHPQKTSNKLTTALPPRRSGAPGVRTPLLTASSTANRPGVLAQQANSRVGWVHSPSPGPHNTTAGATVKMEAYLGPNKPETLAVGEVEVNVSEVQYAVVRVSRSGDPAQGEWVGAYTHYGPAVSAVNQQTTHKHYGVLCSVRPAQVAAVTK